MYQEVFNFNSQPFTQAPFVNNFVEVGPVKASFDQIKNAIARDAGPSVVVGQHGTGKSLLLSLLGKEYQQRFKIVSLACGPMSERRDLLQAILFELDQPYREMSEGELRLSLIDYIKPQHKCPHGVLLLVDDAQELTVELIDELRLITNFIRNGVPRVRLVMAGTGRFEDVLAEPKLEPFNQRISARCFLGNLNRDQTRAYILEHVSRAGGNAEEMFEQATTDAIHETTSGCARFVNQLCEQALIAAANRGMLVVEPDVVQVAWAQVQGLPVQNDLAPTEAVGQVSSDEEWTVIEFGSLDDEDETESVGGTAADGPASQLEQNESQTASCNVDSAVQPATEYLDSCGANDSVEVAEQDPYSIGTVEHDNVSNDASVPDTLEDPYAYSSLVSEPESGPEVDATTQHSIPTEVQSLYADQQATWEAAGQAVAADLTSDGEVEGVSDDVFNDADYQTTPDTEAVARQEAVMNPFDETFDSEETVAEGFTGLIASQNVSSLEVTGQELESLQPMPIADPSTDVSSVEVSSVEVSSVEVSSVEVSPAEEVGKTSDSSPHAEIEVSVFDSSDAESGEAGIESDVTERSELELVEQATEPDAVPTEYSANELMGVFGALAEPTAIDGSDRSPEAMETEPIVSHANGSMEPVYELVSPETPDADFTDAAEVDSFQAESHSHEGDLVSQEVRDRLEAAMSSLEAESGAEQGREIARGEGPVEESETQIEQLRAADGQSECCDEGINPEHETSSEYPPTSPLSGSYHNHQTFEATPDIQQRADKILQSIQVPSTDRIQESQVAVPHETESVSPDHAGDAIAPEPVQSAESDDNSELTESQKILNEILEQKDLLKANVHDPVRPDVSPSLDEMPHEPETYSMAQPLSEISNAGSEITEDDSDIIVVSGIPEAESPADDVNPESSVPSTGRAKRMDYERLFEQLRDNGKND